MNQQQKRKEVKMTKRTHTSYTPMAEAVGEAMERSQPFTWLKNRNVQVGVYLWYSQEHFNKYELPKRLAKVAA
jgi:hypothetical protein